MKAASPVEHTDDPPRQPPTVERDQDDGTRIVICPDLLLAVELFDR